MSTLADIFKGIAEGSTSGLVDELGGLLRSGFNREPVKVNAAALEPQPGDSPEVLTMKALMREGQASQPTQYELGRNAVRQSQAKAAADSGTAFKTAEVLGALLPAVALTAGTGGAGALLPSALARTAAGTGGRALAARAGLGAAAGGLQGALTAAGKSEAEPMRGEGEAFWGDVKGGGLGGAVVGGGLPLLGAALAGGANWAAELEPIRRLRAAGFTPTDIKNVTLERGRELGRWMKERSIIPAWGRGGEEAIDQNIANVLTREGPVIGEQLGRVTERPDPFELLQNIGRRVQELQPTSRRLQAPTNRGLVADIEEKFGFQPQPTARALAAQEEMAQRVANAERQLASGKLPTQRESVMQRLEQEARETEMRPTNDITALSLNRMKSDIQDQTNYAATNAAESAANQAYAGVASDVRDAVRGPAQRSLSPEDWARLDSAWREYGNAEAVANVMRGRMAMQSGQATMPLSAWLSTIGAGAMTGNPALAVGAGVAQKIAKHRGDAIMATLQSGLSSEPGRQIAASATHPFVAQAIASALGRANATKKQPVDILTPTAPAMEPEPTPAEPPLPSVEAAPPTGPVEASAEPEEVDFETFKRATQRRAGR